MIKFNQKKVPLLQRLALFISAMFFILSRFLTLISPNTYLTAPNRENI